MCLLIWSTNEIALLVFILFVNAKKKADFRRRDKSIIMIMFEGHVNQDDWKYLSEVAGILQCRNLGCLNLQFVPG